MSNPLQQLSGLPPFSQIRPQHVKPAVEQAIADGKATVERLLATESRYNWDNLVAPLEESGDSLSRLWSPVSHMNSVVNTPELREAHDACLPLLSEYGTWMGQHEGLFNAYQQIRDSAEFAQLTQAQQKVITDALRDFRLSGIGLPTEQQQRFGEIQARMAELSSTFNNRLMDATQAWTKLVTDEGELSGLPESALAAAKEAAEAKGETGYLLTLEFPSYLPVMTYCDNRELRAEMYQAFSTRASDQGPQAGQFDNSAVMDEMVALRHEQAQILGFDSYADLSLATKMARDPLQVSDFLEDLGRRSLPQAKQDLAEVREFASKTFAATELEAWDVGYYSEKLKQQRYAISDELLRPYFPEDRVLSGLFEVVKRVFGLEIRELATGSGAEAVDSWHEAVRYFEIHDEQGELRGSFYLDLYAREHKRGGAWMDECIVHRKRLDGSRQAPVAYLTCNFNKPVGNKPALFTHDEVLTLFHEFGHGIHHMLTKVEPAAVSGINGVPWDAVELPSQFMENFCWQPEALAFISGHYESGEPLPAELLEKLLAARNFQSAMQMVRQLEFSLFDFRLHWQFSPAQGAQIQQVLDQVRSEVAVIKAPEFNRFQHGFGHIFGGGYSAGYYSYKWAEVLSSDAFERFEEEGIFNRETGRSFMENVLERGGSDEPMVLFTAFRGREPQVDALLRHSGIVHDLEQAR